MKKILIDGIIGWDVSAKEIRRQIEDIGNEDFTIEINSPGGLVTEGLAIFNSIKNAKGRKEVLISGIAASMGSVIALAGDIIRAEANSVFMIHNAVNFEYGDHRALRKAADIAEGFTKILRAEYVKKTGKNDSEISAMMDEESFFFGKEMKEAGFVDEIIGENTEEKASAILKVKSIVSTTDTFIRTVSNEKDFEQAAAQMRGLLGLNNAAVSGKNQAAGPENQQEVKEEMTEEEIKALETKARQSGIDAERNRVATLNSYSGQDPETDKIVNEAIASGKTLNDVQASIIISLSKNAKAQSGQNQPDAETMQSDPAGIDEEDIEAMAIFGTPKDEYVRISKGGK